MHHVSADKRAHRSAELIYGALRSCLEGRSFDRITVSDIQRASGVARTTFYRAFDDVSDVLSWKCEMCFHEALSDFKPQDFVNEMELAERFLEYWMGRSEILELLIRIDRQDIIYASHARSAEALRKKFGELPFMTEAQGRYFLTIRTGFLVSALSAWMQGGCKESPSEMMRMLKTQLMLLPSPSSGCSSA